MTSFKNDIKTKFRPQDIACMNRQQIPIADYDYMSDPAGDGSFPDHANARHVLARLSGTENPRMPLNGPYWSDEDLATLTDWINGGYQP